MNQNTGDDTLDRFQWTIGMITAYKSRDARGMAALLDGKDVIEVTRSLVGVLAGMMEMLSMIIDEPVEEMLKGMSLAAEDVWNEGNV